MANKKINTLAKALLWLGAKMAGPTASYTLTDDALGKFFGGTTAAGKVVNEDTATQITAAWGCMRVISEAIGSLPWALYQKDGKGNAVVAEDHRLNILLHRPNADMTEVEYKEAWALNVVSNGNSYSFRESSGKDTVSLYPIESRHCEPKRKEDGTVFYRVLDRGKWTDFPREKIFHVKGFGRTGLVGLSPIGAAREAMGTALAAEEFGGKFFTNGGLPAGVITIPGWLNPDQRKIARENLQQMLGGLGNSHKFALFEGGLKPEPWEMMPLEDMQFLSLRQFSVLEMCRIFRVPPHMVAELSRATFANIEQMSLDFVMFTLMPYCTRFEAALKRWLLPPGDFDKYAVKFNFEGLLRADSQARGEFYAKLLQNGVMSRNEVRAKENLNSVDGLETYTVQSNMVPVDKLAALADAQVEKAKQPPSLPNQQPQVEPNVKELFDAVRAAVAQSALISEAMKSVLADSAKLQEFIHQHLQEKSLPQFKELARSFKDSQLEDQRQFKRIMDNVLTETKKQAEIAQRSAQSCDELKEVMSSPREIYDTDGTLLGTTKVVH